MFSITIFFLCLICKWFSIIIWWWVLSLLHNKSACVCTLFYYGIVFPRHRHKFLPQQPFVVSSEDDFTCVDYIRRVFRPWFPNVGIKRTFFLASKWKSRARTNKSRQSTEYNKRLQTKTRKCTTSRTRLANVTVSPS